MTSSRPREWLYIVLLVVLPVLFLAPGLWRVDAMIRPSYSPYSDLTVIHWPKVHLLRQTLAAEHQLPLWSPLILSGQPLAGNQLAMLFYPPAWLLILPLPVGWAFSWFFAAHLALAGVGTFLFLRKGLARSEAASFVAAVGFAFTGKFVAHVAGGHLSLVPAMAWLPWAVWGTHRTLTRRRAGDALLTGVALAAQATTHSYALLYTAYLLAAYTLYMLLTAPAPRWPDRLSDAIRALPRLALIPITAALLGAAQLLPLLEMAPYSNRALAAAESVMGALSPLTLAAGLLFPSAQAGHEPVIYPGLLVVILAALAVRRWQERPVPFFAALVLGGALLSLGDATPLYPLVVRALPGLRWVRTPARLWFFVAFGLAVLSAYGWETLAAGWHGRARRRLTLAAAGGAFGAVLLSGGLTLLAGRVERGITGLGLFALLSAIVLIWAARARPRPARLLVVTLAVLLLDLWSFGYTALRFRPEAEVFATGRAVAERLAGWMGDTPERVYSPGYSLPQHVAAAYGLELADGAEPVHLAAYDRYMGAATGVPLEGFSVTVPPFPEGAAIATAHRDAVPNLKLLGLLNVRYLAADFDVRGEGLIERARFGQTRVFENPLAMPRAFVVGRVEPVGDEAEALARLAALDPRQTAVVEGGPPLTGGTTSQTAAVLARSPNRIAVEAQLDAPGLLVLSEVWYPGWRATDNGQPVPIHRADGILRGVYLGRGSHRVVFDYRPLSVRAGEAASALAALALAGYLAWAASRARRRTP